MTAPHQCGIDCIRAHSTECDARWHRRNRLHDLLATWNHATNPRALRSDEERAEYRKVAESTMAKIRAEFKEGLDYVEWDSDSSLHPL